MKDYVLPLLILAAVLGFLASIILARKCHHSCDDIRRDPVCE